MHRHETSYKEPTPIILGNHVYVKRIFDSVPNHKKYTFIDILETIRAMKLKRTLLHLERTVYSNEF